MQTNASWNFDNSYTRLPKLFFTRQNPIRVRAPELVAFNHSLAVSLGAPMQTDVFAGNQIPEGAEPLAQAYAGHQFGHFTMLGDGRALLLGEQITPGGQRFDVALKGCGRTAYSRGGDGRAALGPMLREYIVSEAMFALGIPTTRSLAVAATGQDVVREKTLPGAVLTRIAQSHIRVGTFEYAAHFGGPDDVRSLADYTIARHFPDILPAGDKYLLMLKEVVKRQALLISKWQLAGFIHGVMNTDNMAISGQTIDYGPCAFMDVYNPATVFSSIDAHGRYSYENQPKMAAWNLARFAETLLPLLHGDEREAIRLGQEEIANFWDLYRQSWLAGMRAKLGLPGEQPGDEALATDILHLMQRTRSDYTNTLRALTLDEKDDTPLFSQPDFHRWSGRWQARLDMQAKTKDEAGPLMRMHNPAIIPRNHLVEQALDAAGQGDLTVMDRLLGALSSPYDYTPEQEQYAKLPQPTSCRYQTFCGT